MDKIVAEALLRRRPHGVFSRWISRKGSPPRLHTDNGPGHRQLHFHRHRIRVPNPLKPAIMVFVNARPFRQVISVRDRGCASDNEACAHTASVMLTSDFPVPSVTGDCTRNEGRGRTPRLAGIVRFPGFMFSNVVQDPSTRQEGFLQYAELQENRTGVHDRSKDRGRIRGNDRRGARREHISAAGYFFADCTEKSPAADELAGRLVRTVKLGQKKIIT